MAPQRVTKRVKFNCVDSRSEVNRLDTVRRLLPLLIGPASIVALSFALTMRDRAIMRWGQKTYVHMSLWTASGPFSQILYGSTIEAWFWSFFWGIPLAYAMLAYSIHASKFTARVTWIGFALWLLTGYAGTRAGV